MSKVEPIKPQLHIMNLPDEMLDSFISYLFGKDLLMLMESCTRMRDLILKNKIFMNRILLVLQFPLKTSSEQFALLLKTKRKYQNLKIVRIRDKMPVAQPLMDSFFQVLTLLKTTIRECRLDWSLVKAFNDAFITDEIMRRNNRARDLRVEFPPPPTANHICSPRASSRDEVRPEVVAILNVLDEIEVCSAVCVYDERCAADDEILPKLEKLRVLKIQTCNSVCFEIFFNANKLTTLSVLDPWWKNGQLGVNGFENFLFSQKNLKELTMRNFFYPRLFFNDRSNDVQFQLTKIHIVWTYFSDFKYLLNFFKTQKSLKEINLQLANEKVLRLDDLLCYNSILKCIFTTNLKLEKIKITKHRYTFESLDFLDGITNPNVTNLKYYVTNDKNSDFFKALLRMFPNLKIVSYESAESEENESAICFDNSTLLEHVEDLTIANASVRSLVHVHSTKLKKFAFIPGKNSEFIDDYFGVRKDFEDKSVHPQTYLFLYFQGFLHLHRNIKKLTIGRDQVRSYFFVTYNLCEMIVNFLSGLEHLTIFNFAEVNKSVKLLCQLKSLCSLTLTSEQYQQFTAKTKIECQRNQVKIMTVPIPAERTTDENTQVLQRSFE